MLVCLGQVGSSVCCFLDLELGCLFGVVMMLASGFLDLLAALWCSGFLYDCCCLSLLICADTVGVA